MNCDQLQPNTDVYHQPILVTITRHRLPATTDHCHHVLPNKVKYHKLSPTATTHSMYANKSICHTGERSELKKRTSLGVEGSLGKNVPFRLQQFEFWNLHKKHLYSFSYSQSIVFLTVSAKELRP